MRVNSRHGFARLGRRDTLYADREVKRADLPCRMEVARRLRRSCALSGFKRVALRRRAEAGRRRQRICTHSGFKRVVGHSCRAFCILLSVARTARSSPSGGMADTEVSKTSGGNLVRVRPSPRAPRIRPALRIARPAFFFVSMPKRVQRKQPPGRDRRKQPPGVPRPPSAPGATRPQPPAASPPIAGRGCVRAPSSSWCRHRGREADASSAESRPPHGAGSRAWRAYRRHEDPSCPRYRRRWCHR